MRILLFTSLCIALWACKSKPVIIEEDTPSQTSASMEASTEENISPPSNGESASPMDLHEIKVLDIFHSAKYTYLEVLEKNSKGCVAIPLNKEVKKDKTYYFRGGILMANQEKLNFSQSYDAVHIVAMLSDSPSMNEMNTASEIVPSTPESNKEINIKSLKIVPIKGAIKLSELLNAPEKYEGKNILVQGIVVKMNRMILNKNWIHIQDNTSDKKGNKCDLTITTLDESQIGDLVAFEGIISLHKDFGAGYQYDIILEEAKLKK